jgi:hypothetical protein
LCINDCHEVNCSGNGECEDSPGGFTCACDLCQDGSEFSCMCRAVLATYQDYLTNSIKFF